MRSFLSSTKTCFAQSGLTLLQGQDVFDAYENIAPNPKKVLNIQLGPEDHISPAQLQKKLASMERGQPLTIAYVGRMMAIKGRLIGLRRFSVQGRRESDSKQPGSATLR